MALSGGMKRRVMIAKALSHEPPILFLDEPTAGVDVELRRDMWEMVRKLRESGVTIILTTHYIEEAEEMADRIGVISKGEIILVEDKAALMEKLGKKQLTLQLQAPLAAIPAGPGRLSAWSCRPTAASSIYTFDAQPRGHRHRRPDAPARRARASTSRTCRPGRARWRTSSSAWCTAADARRSPHEPPRRPRHLHASSWRAGSAP